MAVSKLEETAKASRDKSDQMADIIAQFCGSFTFVWVHLIWFAAWIVMNVVPGLPQFGVGFGWLPDGLFNAAGPNPGDR